MPPAATELAETGPDQRRWLSLPGSRIVINPYDFDGQASPLEYSTGLGIPLHLGYYVGDRAIRLRSILQIRPRITAGQNTNRTGRTTADPAWDGIGSVRARSVDGLEAGVAGWSTGNHTDASVVDAGLRLVLRPGAPEYWGEARRLVALDVDAETCLRVRVVSVADAWGLRLRYRGVDHVLQSDTRTVGTFTYELAGFVRRSGARGRVDVQLVLRAATWERPAVVASIEALTVNPVLGGAAQVDHSWSPHRLTATGRYVALPDVGVRDLLVNKDVVLRRMTLPPAGGWVLAGRADGRVKWRAGMLCVQAAGFAYVVAVSTPVGDVRLAADEPGQLAGVDVEQCRVSNLAAAYWTADLRAGVTGNAPAEPRSVDIAVAFATDAEGGVGTARRRARAVLGRDLGRVEQRRERTWDRLLRRVPRPVDFAVRAVDPHGVSADDVRRTYYAAWVFLAANVLPPLPEGEYGFPQLAAGKPSLYADGPPGAAASAAWESLLAMGVYAYIDPATSVAAYVGLLSLVGADGRLGGESLPARKAQTAAVLLGVTSDRAAIARSFPALRRHLLWAADNPRWIHRDLTPPDQKDAQFLASALVDLECAAELADRLGDTQDSADLRQRADGLAADYLRWCWVEPVAAPDQWVVPSTGHRDSGNILWIAGGLHTRRLPRESPQRKGMLARFDGTYDSRRPFAGFLQPKHPDIEYAVLGLLDEGAPDRVGQAVALANSGLRDVVRAGQFAEVYTETDPPRGSGVRPSCFGALEVITTVWWNNGYRADLATPALVGFGSKDGSPERGIRNLRVAAGTLHLRGNAGSASVRLSGTAVRGRQQDVEVADGATVPIPLCAG